MKRQLEQQDKPHKQHRSKKEKLVKKLQYKKHKQTIKKKLLAEKEAQRESHAETIARNIHLIIKKLLKYNASSETELPELLDNLDKGHEVDIFNIEDPYVKHKLYKLFRLLGVQSMRAKYTFKVVKGPKTSIPRWKVKTLKERILEAIKECKEEIRNEVHLEEEKPQVKVKKEEVVIVDEGKDEEIIKVKPIIKKIQKGASFLAKTMKVIDLDKQLTNEFSEQEKMKEREALNELFQFTKSNKQK